MQSSHKEAFNYSGSIIKDKNINEEYHEFIEGFYGDL